MPTLDWMGKDRVVDYYHQVPYRILERIPDKGVLDSYGSDCGNMIIHGDNLEALKSLLPEYEGQVDCIYIDPPYNTGEEKWVYNDNVNDPRIQQWIGQVVGTEGQDLTRHDKWLCMMYPRLRLLKELLSDEGFIAVSINDVEVSNLGLLLDEIFGTGNRLACAPWRAEKSGGKEKTALRTGHEYIYFYQKTDRCRIALEEKSTGKLDLKDKFGKYRKGRELRKWGATSDRTDRPNGWFGIKAPDGSIAWPYKNDGTEGYWRWTKSKKEMQNLLRDPEYAHWEMAPYDEGVAVNGQTERWVPYEKVRDEKKSFGWNTWLDGYGTNSDATAELKALFGSKLFDTPKPISLVKWIVSLAYDDDAIILDSFAGSGTTAHAVLELNGEDEGLRRFILIEMMDYADTITAERIRRAIAGYDNLSPKKSKNAPSHFDALGGGFSFYELGPALFVDDAPSDASYHLITGSHNGADNELDPTIPRLDVMRYVWYTETKARFKDRTDEHPYLMGEIGGVAYYFAWEPDSETTLDYELLAQLPVRGETTVIYADRCVLDDGALNAMNVRYKQIPREIARM